MSKIVAYYDPNYYPYISISTLSKIGYSDAHSDEKRVIRRLPDSPINRSALVSNQEKEKFTSPHQEDYFDYSSVKFSSRDRSAPKDSNTLTTNNDREKSLALQDMRQECHRSSKHDKGNSQDH